MSHIQQQRQLFAINKREVLKLLRWDELAYHQFQYDQAFAYLFETFRMDEYWIKYITQTPEFWKFWINEWNLIDARYFIPQVYDATERAEQLYRKMHQPQFLNSYPHRDVFDQAYCQMIGATLDFHTLNTTEPCNNKK